LIPEAQFCRFCGNRVAVGEETATLGQPSSVGLNFCRHCGKPLLEGANFCEECGSSVIAITSEREFSNAINDGSSRAVERTNALVMSPWKQMVSSLKKTKTDLLQKSRYAFNNLRAKLTEKMDQIILDLENPQKYRDLKGTQRTNLIETVQRIKQKVDSSDITEEELKEAQDYIKDLNKRLKGDKCLVCLKTLKPGDYVVACPNCSFAGHNQHLTDWIADRGECPLCKSQLNTKQLIHFQLAESEE